MTSTAPGGRVPPPEELVKSIIAAWPSLTPEQKQALAAVLPPPWVAAAGLFRIYKSLSTRPAR